MSVYRCDSKLYARNMEEFRRMGKELRPGERLDCADFFPMMFPGSNVPEEWRFVSYLALEHQQPCYMLRGYSADPAKPVHRHTILGEHFDQPVSGRVPINIMATSITEDRKLLSLIFSLLQRFPYSRSIISMVGISVKAKTSRG